MNGTGPTGVTGRSRRRTGLGAVAGVLAAGVALGVGQLVAGITGANGSPVVAVGQLQIDFTPPWLKNFAISEFGSDDKLVLVCGILVVLAIFAAVIGALATRRLAYGMAGLGVFAVVGLVAASTRPTATVASVLPTLFATAAAAIALRALIGRADQPTELSGEPWSDSWTDAWAITEPTGPPRPDPAPADGSPADGPATATVPPDVPVAPDLPAGAGQPPASGSVIRPSASQGPYQPERPASHASPRRRSFLAASAATAGVAAVAGLAGRLLAERSSVANARNALRIPKPAATVPGLPPGVNLNVPGITPFVTSDNAFYRVDTAIVLPQVDPSSWQLRIHGMVSNEITLTFDELIRRPLIEDWVTLCCVSNPVGGPYIGNALWLGASLASVLRDAGVKAGANQLLCTSVDGFTSGTPIQTVMDGRDALLAVAMNGQPLPIAHGFPVRMVVPGLYGYVSATKWVTDIEVTTFSQAYAYWAVRGWSQQAPIKTESRIDVPTGTNTIQAGKTAVAGVAWAQHKGIDAVHVRVDSGPWNQATLAAVPGIDTWRQWVWYWDATPGNHLIECRATDVTGYTQTGLDEPPEPNGATGYPQVQVSVG
ncbi:MAG TPA: molybdopterin-dependent oxidoreductase [Streptosporangiaceae bacterium]|nr:molybdopterin-dependent oxidoreductase [Streptosporangiaceae bacterium]